MKEFTNDQLASSNKIHQVIKLFRHFFPHEFEKCDIEWCEKCSGNGFTQNVFQDGVSFSGLGVVCQKCNGVGYFGYKYFEDGRVCNSCNGVGCEGCNHKGSLDWIKAAMSGGT